jgi:hypothetical protein
MADIKFQDGDPTQWSSELARLRPLSRNEKLIARVLILVVAIVATAITAWIALH